MKKILLCISLIALASCGTTDQEDSSGLGSGTTVYVGDTFTGVIPSDSILREEQSDAVMITNIPGDSLSGVVDISSNF